MTTSCTTGSSPSDLLEAIGGHCPPAEMKCDVCGRAADFRARSVRPVEIGRAQVLSFDVGAEVCVSAASGEVVENHADGDIGRATALPQWRSDVEGVHCRVVQRAMDPAV